MLADLPYLAALILTLTVLIAMWPISVWLRDASVIDGWWGPGFLAQLLLVFSVTDAVDIRDIVLVGLIGIWSLRLGWLLVSRRVRGGEEDPRYGSLRKAWEPGFWWKSLFVVFILQGVIQWLIAVGPITGILGTTSPLGWVAAAGIVVAIVGLATETLADVQLDRFKRTHSKGALCRSGLRAWVRHPNYLGEIVFWVGIGLIVSEVSLWAAILSPVLITVFLAWVSGAPMLDERMSETRPDYAEYKSQVPGFLPSFRQVRQSPFFNRSIR